MLTNKLEHFLDSLPRGPLLRKIYYLLLWIAAGILAFAGLFYIIDLLMSLAQAANPAQVLGTIFAALISVAGVALAVLVILARTQGIDEFSFLKDYSVIHLLAQLLRLAGEVVVIFHLVTGLSAGVMLWFGSQPHLPYFDSLMWKVLSYAAFPSFLSGLFAILSGTLQAAITLLLYYAAAELLFLLRDIALKSRR